MGILDKIFLPKRTDNDFSLSRYLRDLEEDEFRDRWNLGVCEANGGSWLLKDFTKEPNAVFIGAMGSGKSVAANYTIMSWMLANSDQTVLFITDTVKGANDYQALFEYEQVYPIHSEAGVHRVLDLMYDEVMARREAFNEVQAESIIEYERKTGKKLSRIVLLMEEFHAIPYALLNYDKDYKIELTSAFKFHQIMRIGRSMGAWVVACSQKGTKSDIPSEIIPNFTQKQIFRVSKAEAAYFLSDVKASEIRSDQKGRCETDYGSVQFPYMPMGTQRQLLKKYMKPLESECCYLTPKLIEDYLNGKSTEELYRLKKLDQLVQGIEAFDHELVVAMMHKKLGHKVTPVDSKIDPFGISLILDWPNKGRVAVMIRVGKAKLTGKHLHKLSKGMDAMGCQRGILYTSAEDLPQSLYKNAGDRGIEIVDHEDMLRLARQIEHKAKNLEDLDPSKLADDSKESGDYQKEKNIPNEDIDMTEEQSDPQAYETGPAEPKIAPAVKTTYIQDMDEKKQAKEAEKALEDLLPKAAPTPPAKVDKAPSVMEEATKPEEVPLGSIEEMQNQDVDLSKTADSLIASVKTNVKQIKRIPVRGTFSLRADECPEVLIHFQKNENGEVYRALFMTLVDKKAHHKYFIDRQVTGIFSVKDRAKLGIIDTAEWNAQVDQVNQNRPVYDTQEFEKQVLLYLENFKQYEFGAVKAICWKEDASFLKSILEKSRYMDPVPTVIEEVAQAILGMEADRELLLTQNGMNIKRVDIFLPANIDHEIWKYVSP